MSSDKNTDNNRGSDDDEDWIEEFGREEFENDEDDEDDEDDEEKAEMTKT